MARETPFELVPYKHIQNNRLFEQLEALHEVGFKGDNYDLPRRNPSGSSWIVAEDKEGKPIGFSLLQMKKKPDHLLVHSVVVSPEHQRKGIASALLNWVEEQSKYGLPVRARVSSSNTRMINLNKKRGWERIKTAFEGVTRKRRGARREDELLFEFR